MRVRSLRLLYFGLSLLAVGLPADRLSLLPGIPVDFRVAAPFLVAAGLVAFAGKPNRKACLALAGLAALKLLLWPLTIQHGLIGTYYSTPDFTGPVEEVRLDRAVDFGDESFPLGFLNDLRFNVLSPPLDRQQRPFSARWDGYVIGQPLLQTDQKATIQSSAAPPDMRRVTIRFSKGWGPHAFVKLAGVRALYPQYYSAAQIGAGSAARILQDALVVAFGLVLLAGLPTVSSSWPVLLFSALSVQGYVRAWPYQGKSLLLAAGQDWLTYESEARDILRHGWLMNGGAPLFAGRPFYQQAFYAYFVALGHRLTGGGFGGIFFGHYLLLAATAALMYALAGELFGRNVGLIASLLFVWFQQKYLLQYSDLLLSENLVYPLAVGGVYLYVRQFRTKAWGEVLGAGVLLGLAADTRSTIVAFVLAAGIVLFWRQGWRAGVLFAAAAAAMLTFILARNYLVSGQVALLPTY
ncbi:MAG: glycosyltransferase family 39 protein, partial [Chloroflexota bacterium]|nr:glycosyltransferase family 39 protein [Chloroflexota bacterium]